MRGPSLPARLVLASLLCCGCGPVVGSRAVAVAAAAIGVDAEAGKVVRKASRFGEYVQYLPRREARGVLVVVHGMPTEKEAKDIAGLAEKFLGRWVGFAEEQRLIALAPAFDDENFDSVEGVHGGGYRGLFGRQVGADDFVDGIVATYRPSLPGWDGRIVLYGHSAGAQFANRYCVRHPDRVRAAAISAAGWFAMPDPSAHWPSGMGRWKTSFRWDPARRPRPVDVTPDPAGWIKAATLPLTVIVGTADTEVQKARDGHRGRTRVDYGRQWVDDMNDLARARHEEGRVRLVLVEGVGHDSARLTPAAQRALAKALGPGRGRE